MGREPTFGEPLIVSLISPRRWTQPGSRCSASPPPQAEPLVRVDSPLAIFMNVPQRLRALPKSHWRNVRRAPADSAVGHPKSLSRPSNSSYSRMAPSWTPRDRPACCTRSRSRAEGAKLPRPGPLAHPPSFSTNRTFLPNATACFKCSINANYSGFVSEFANRWVLQVRGIEMKFRS